MTRATVALANGKRIDPVRFWAWVDKAGPNDCWRWTGRVGVRSRVSSGYARYGHLFAHRIAFELSHGPIPTGLEIDHLCRVQNCVNPGHLEAVTSEENRRRRREAQTHCKRGHEFTDENTYMTGIGARQCRACVRIRERQYRDRKKAAA